MGPGFAPRPPTALSPAAIRDAALDSPDDRGPLAQHAGLDESRVLLPRDGRHYLEAWHMAGTRDPPAPRCPGIWDMGFRTGNLGGRYCSVG